MRKTIKASITVALLCGAVGLQAQDTSQVRANEKGYGNMRIKIASVFVSDQETALRFYTEVLGFVKKHDVPVGEFRWLTVVSPDEPDGTELLLEPNSHSAAKNYQKAIFEEGIPATTFFVEDIQKECERLTRLGVKFTMKPTKIGLVTIAVFDDTCGNLIQITQE